MSNYNLTKEEESEVLAEIYQERNDEYTREQEYYMRDEE